MRTARQIRGAAAEDIAVLWLVGQGWRVVARNVRVGVRDEIDIVALDPGSPHEVVCVEVRSARAAQFGAPEERVGARKIGNLYRAAVALCRSEVAYQLGVVGRTARVDLLVVDLRGGTPRIRHLKCVGPA